MSEGSSPSRSEYVVLHVMVTVFVLKAIYKAAVPGPGEWPSQTVALMTLGLDIVVTVFIVLLGRRLAAVFPETGRIRALVGLGLAAGVALLAFRFLSHGGFYTGHLFEMRVLPPS